MVALPIIGIVFCFAYIIFILFKYGVPVSISETSYLLPAKLNWMFAAWCVLTAAPFGIWWFTIAPPNLKWMAVITVIAILMIGVSSFYKSNTQPIPDNQKKQIRVVGSSQEYTANATSNEKESIWERIKEILAKFKPSEFLKYGWARLIHYVNSLIAIAMVNAYVCIVSPVQAVVAMVLMNLIFIIIGTRVDGAYNPDFSTDVDNKAWIFFMEVVCFLEIFIFVW